MNYDVIWIDEGEIMELCPQLPPPELSPLERVMGTSDMTPLGGPLVPLPDLYRHTCYIENGGGTWVTSEPDEILVDIRRVLGGWTEFSPFYDYARNASCAASEPGV